MMLKTDLREKGRSTVPHTAIMQVWTEDIMIERIVQYAWMILDMDDSMLKLLA